MDQILFFYDNSQIITTRYDLGQNIYDCSVQYSKVQYSTVQYSTVQYSTVQGMAVRNFAVSIMTYFFKGVTLYPQCSCRSDKPSVE